MKLHESWIEVLARHPETGMGFQVLELGGGYAGLEHAIVVNGTHLLERTTGPLRLRERLPMVAEAGVLAALQERADVARFRVLSLAEAQRAGILAEGEAGEGPAGGAPIEVSSAGERFLRFSAYDRDNRILPDGSVTPGTYVTSYEDGISVGGGYEAVCRYALPNPEPAVHRYHLDPPRSIPVRRGTVQPAFGHPGGGVEVIFENGSPAGTKRGQDQIPAGKPCDCN